MGKSIFLLIMILISGVAGFGLDKYAVDIASAIGYENHGNQVAASANSQVLNAGTPYEALCGSSEKILKCQQMEQSILSTTLRIEIKTWIIYVEGQGYTSLFSNGHGTVMNGRYLLTHNHFRLPLLELMEDELDGELATITLYSAGGDLLWQGPLTTAAVAYDDSETLLLEFLNKDGRGLFESLGIPSAEFIAEGSDTLAPGATVAQVNWDKDQAYVQWAKVEAVADENGTPLIDLTECLIPGSSGGGVFLNGAHIANNWSRSHGCVEESNDESQLYSTAALNSTELLAAIQ